VFTGKYRVGGLLWLAKWTVIVLVTTLAADCLYVMWPYPGEARGVPAFEAMIDREWKSSVRFAGARLPALAYAIHDGLHAAFFEWTGLDYLLDGASDAGTSRRPHALMRDSWGPLTPFFAPPRPACNCSVCGSVCWP